MVTIEETNSDITFSPPKKSEFKQKILALPFVFFYEVTCLLDRTRRYIYVMFVAYFLRITLDNILYVKLKLWFYYVTHAYLCHFIFYVYTHASFYALD